MKSFITFKRLLAAAIVAAAAAASLVQVALAGPERTGAISFFRERRLSCGGRGPRPAASSSTPDGLPVGRSSSLYAGGFQCLSIG
jgi:hypothetical protein